MALTAFTNRIGIGQGRIRTPRAVDGEFAFVLGEDAAGYFFDLAPGDGTEVTQDVDLTGVTLVRAVLRLRVPASTPAGLAWEVSIVVDGTKLARVSARRGRERLVTDLAANVSSLAGTHVVGVRLELVTEFDGTGTA